MKKFIRFNNRWLAALIACAALSALSAACADSPSEPSPIISSSDKTFTKTSADELKIRVGLMNTNFVSLDHDAVIAQSAGGMTLTDKAANKQIAIEADAALTMTVVDGQIAAQVNGAQIYLSANRLYLSPTDAAAKIQITSHQRDYGIPAYRGVFEIFQSKTAGKLNLINELPIEDYLRQVVPSEMPATFHPEALKVQSVAARTYAMKDYFGKRAGADGYHVVDSTASQVYNNRLEEETTTQAIAQTKGIVARAEGKLIDALFYSTSCGLGAASEEVWNVSGTPTFPGAPVSYLQAKSYTYDPENPQKTLYINPADEIALNSFFKNLSYQSYDEKSPNFRWKVTFSKKQLETLLNTQLAARHKVDKYFIQTKNAQGEFVSQDIPEEALGSLKNIYVARRGAGGILMEVVVEGTNGTYKIVKELNFRYVFRPSKSFAGGDADVELYRAKGHSSDYAPALTMKNTSLLPSAYASLELERDASGEITSLTIYGGGSGHGVGMSQYGAYYLAEQGWSYEQILKEYYSGIELVNLSSL